MLSDGGRKMAMVVVGWFGGEIIIGNVVEVVVVVVVILVVLDVVGKDFVSIMNVVVITDVVVVALKRLWVEVGGVNVLRQVEMLRHVVVT